MHATIRECAQNCVGYTVKKCVYEISMKHKQNKAIVLKEGKSCSRECTEYQGDQNCEKPISLPKCMVDCVCFPIQVCSCKAYFEQ